jgi:hypothetical protein
MGSERRATPTGVRCNWKTELGAICTGGVHRLCRCGTKQFDGMRDYEVLVTNLSMDFTTIELKVDKRRREKECDVVKGR